MIHSIPWTAPTQPAPAGLLNSPDWWYPLAYAFVLLLALVLMPGQLRESLRPLWAPVGRWIASLSAPWLWEGLFLWSALSGAFLAPLRVLESIFRVVWSWGRSQLRRLAYLGYETPILT